MFDSELIKPILEELKNGKKTYSVTGFAIFSNIAEYVPTTVPEWTELFNLGAAIIAFTLVSWRLGSKYISWRKQNGKN